MEEKQYDYKKITVERKYAPNYIDGYEGFGWELKGISYHKDRFDGAKVTLKFRRSAQIPNKSELSELQRRFEFKMKEISHMNKARNFLAAAVAYVIGVAGTVLLLGSILAFVLSFGVVAVALVVMGLIGWLIAYPSYKNARKRKTAEISPSITQRFKEINRLKKNAGQLLPLV
ncbi:hypothetical protein JCM15457_1889 [Liquorilactobacillus sucicola DSM 21376 = JCM 15457]|uniref:Uncharacterized protein n=1 Tax=Liquorilactobacillus sucicola DSM 21376 = JCM 15457 TaxID=1423806 RepID=A0A023CZJ6_9LACO|nr:hypothetical protein [Liquorilactobacillus sucicola]KRN06668.1 hypothetical protein FD15_GL000221 [Liquorilactobacillus sucicola DSM 21376 = JCM 15457]GAJ26935.1 hypothetical protein JCM15457_1889 [Liquorilactobacillus sucicola DSM 21376 = JCM 15457]